MIRVVIVDDEELARLRLRGLLAQCSDPPALVVAEAANATQALVALATTPCDLLLLDIRMPGRDGMALADEVRRLVPPPAVVFVTAHAEYALRAVVHLAAACRQPQQRSPMHWGLMYRRRRV